MRITNAMTYATSLRQVQDLTAAQAQVSNQVTTGQRNALVSDDPAAAAQVLQIDSESRAITQYQRNISSVRAGLNGEESTLNQIGDLLNRAKELATSQGDSSANAASRAASAAEVDSLLQQAISLGNLKIGDQYVFGGNVTNTAPFQPNGTYVGDNAVRTTQIGENQSVTTNHNGDQLLVSSGVIQSLTTLRDAMNANDPAAIRDTITNIDTAFDQTQTNLAEVGAGTNALDAAVTQLDGRTATLTNSRSAVAEIPLAEASLKLAQVQTALQAAFLATSKILNTSIVPYLTGVTQ